MVRQSLLIHRIWCGPPMPEDYAAFGDRWLELNPGWELMHWDEAEINSRDWVNQDVIDHLYERDDGRRSIELFVQLADVVAYEILLQFGGVYTNADIEPLRPLEELQEAHGAGSTWVTWEDNAFVVNAIMGSEAGHPFFADVVRRLPARYFDNPLGEMNQVTGPHLLTEVWKKHRVPALPKEAFNPVHWLDVPAGGDAAGLSVPADAFGVHHWGHRRDGRTNRIETPTDWV